MADKLEADETEQRLQAVIESASLYGARKYQQQGTQDEPRSRPIETPRGNPSYQRPGKTMYYCLKTIWRELYTPETQVVFSLLLQSVPDTWENVRYRIERDMGLHSTTAGRSQASFISGKQIVDFEDGSLKRAVDLTDNYLLDEHAVVVVHRRPSTNGIGHYVPLDMLYEWREWFTAADAAQKATNGRKRFSAQERDFHTRTHSHGKGDKWFRRELLHASNYDKKPPPNWHCPQCQAAGDHWEHDCTASEEEKRVAPRLRKMIHGIPRNSLRQVDPESSEGRSALLCDAEGNVYVRIPAKCDKNSAQNAISATKEPILTTTSPPQHRASALKVPTKPPIETHEPERSSGSVDQSYRDISPSKRNLTARKFLKRHFPEVRNC